MEETVLVPFLQRMTEAGFADVADGLRRLSEAARTQDREIRDLIESESNDADPERRVFLANEKTRWEAKRALYSRRILAAVERGMRQLDEREELCRMSVNDDNDKNNSNTSATTDGIPTRSSET